MTELVNKKRTIADLESFFSPCINQNPILNLPRPIFHIIFGEYLSLKNVAWFDNAVLNYRDRMVFISNISNMTVRNFDGCINSKFQVRWLFQRQILLSSLSLTYKFQNNNVTDSTIEIFPLNVFALESLTARDLNEWNDHLLPLLKKCTKLIHLKLDIEVKDLFTIPTFYSGLESIKLGQWATDEILSIIATECPRLVTVTVTTSFDISLDAFINFFKLRGSGLKRFDFDNYADNEDVNNILLQAVKYCPVLTIAPFLTNDLMLTHFGNSCALLEDVYINGQLCTDIGIIAIARGCRHIKILKIWYNKNSFNPCGITDRSIIKVTESCPLLQTLTLDSLAKLTDESLLAIGQNCKNLKELSLTSVNVSEAGLNDLVSSPNLKGLTKIGLSYLSNLTDETLLELVKNVHTTLNHLTLSDCPDISDVGMYHISKYCEKLHWLLLCNVPSVTLPDSVADILMRNPNLTEFHYSYYRGSRIRGIDLIFAPIIHDALHANKDRMKYY